MAMDWTTYESFLGIEGEPADIRTSAIEDAISSFCNGVIDDPAYQENAIVDGEETPIIAARTSTIKCSIKAAPETDIHIGDIVECLGENWIVVELHADKIGIINGEMWLCNNTIKFQNHSPVVNTRCCVVDDGTYSKKSSDPDAFVMTNTYKVYITMDDATKRIYVDKRLGFGEIYSPDGEKILEVYKVTGMDLKSKNYGDGSHLMVLTVQRDVYNAESDSVEDNICDMLKVDAEVVAPSVKGSCIISGKNNARIGTTRKYAAIYKDAKGVEINNINSEWTIVAPTGVTYSTSDDTCSIDIPLDGALIGETISISVKDKDGLYGVFEKKVQVITIG